MLTIYEYIDPAGFLRDIWETRRKKNPQFSLRAWSKHLGLEGHAPLHLMLAGKRAIPRKYIPKFVKSLGLSAREALYFETLVGLQRAKKPEEKDFYTGRLSEISSRVPPKIFEVENFKYLGNPIHMVILEMVELKNFKHEAKWIQSRLGFKASLQEINESIERLITLGLLKEDSGGHLSKSNPYVMAKSDVQDKGVQEYHRRVSHLAAEMIGQQDILEREFNGYALNIDKSSLPKAKLLIREFFKQFIKEIESSPNAGEETYQFNVQFFGLTKSAGGKNGPE